jgi:hypothetical protein
MFGQLESLADRPMNCPATPEFAQWRHEAELFDTDLAQYDQCRSLGIWIALALLAGALLAASYWARATAPRSQLRAKVITYTLGALALAVACATVRSLHRYSTNYQLSQRHNRLALQFNSLGGAYLAPGPER